MDSIGSMNPVRTMWRFGAMALALVTSPLVHAQAYQFVRVTCVASRGYLEIEYKAVEQSVFEGAQRPGRSFAEYGYLDPQSAGSECKLGTTVYAVSTRQDAARASGTCGGSPPIILTVSRNGRVLVDQVAFGDTCNGEPSITSLWLHEGEATNVPAEMSVCIRPRIIDVKDRAPEEVCPYLTPDGAIKATPITSNRIEFCRSREKEDSCLTTDSVPTH